MLAHAPAVRGDTLLGKLNRFVCERILHCVVEPVLSHAALFNRNPGIPNELSQPDTIVPEEGSELFR